MKLRVFTICLILFNIAALIYTLLPLAEFFNLKGTLLDFTINNAGAVGIIGGEDGPTALFISKKLNTPFTFIVIPLLILNISIIMLHIMRKLKK